MRKRKTTDGEIIAEHERAIVEGNELEGYVPVDAHISSNLTFNTSVRFTPEEYTRYREAAAARNMSLSEFLRAAAAAAVQGRSDIDQAAMLEQARKKVRELHEALRT